MLHKVRKKKKKRGSDVGLEFWDRLYVSTSLCRFPWHPRPDLVLLKWLGENVHTISSSTKTWLFLRAGMGSYFLSCHHCWASICTPRTIEWVVLIAPKAGCHRETRWLLMPSLYYQALSLFCTEIVKVGLLFPRDQKDILLCLLSALI